MRHVVMFSGGIGSLLAAKRVADRHGTDNLTLLFADTLIEDADLYRFLVEGAAWIFRRQGHGLMDGLLAKAAATPPSSDMERRKAWLADVRERARAVVPGLMWLVDGRSPWELFAERRFLGNNRVGICSLVLKQEISDRWVASHCDQADTTLYFGIDWEEAERYDRLVVRKAGWRCEAPLCEEPFLFTQDKFEILRRQGIKAPRLYALGFAHNNCGGGCVKAGQRHFAHLLEKLPAVFAEWEQHEADLRATLGDVAILRDRAGGTTKPLPLAQLRRRIEGGNEPDLFDVGTCGCFLNAETVEEPAIPLAA